MKNQIYHILPLATIFLAFTACTKDEEPNTIPATVLDIKVVDETGAPVPNATVALYKNQQSWIQEKDSGQSMITTPNGTARFIHLTDSVFYINAVKGGKSNWEKNFLISGIQQGRAHSATIIIESSKSRQISAAKGKVWRVHSFKVNGTDRTQDSACLADNHWVFFKGDRSGRFERRENATLCASSTSQTESGSWQITPDNNNLKLPENDEVVIYYLQNLSATTIRIQKQTGANVVEYTLVNP
jgi:hypothetical protein